MEVTHWAETTLAWRAIAHHVLDGLRAHDDGEIAVDADEFDLPLERGVNGLFLNPG
jgi:hypothetical protein